jgi:hypothetical protein
MGAEAMRECFLCGRNGAADPLDRHHIFNGPYRKKSEKYGLAVWLCHYRCHIFGKHAVHNNPDAMLLLKAMGQEKVMREQGWDTKRFIQEFGKDDIEILNDSMRRTP